MFNSSCNLINTAGQREKKINSNDRREKKKSLSYIILKSLPIPSEEKLKVNLKNSGNIYIYSYI